MQNWRTYIFSDEPFTAKAYKIFEYQLQNNPVYRRFCEALKGKQILKQVLQRNGPDDPNQIPLLPIRAFKDQKILTDEQSSTCNPQPSAVTFESSGTSGMSPSRHCVKDENIYRHAILKGFNQFYDLDNAVILGYTPGYAENTHSSLVWMINKLIKQDEIKKSRFLPLDEPLNQGEVNNIAASGKQLIMFGAAFGLIDLVKNSSVKLPSNSTVIETGGMKTYQREMNRAEMHRVLARGFDVDITRIHSEYGMCELLSQAYATGGKWFRSVPWMRVSVRNPDDPQQCLPPYQEGLIGVIDLANVHSCSFILTGDRGVMDAVGRFQVLGRWRPADLRGCNFLIDED